MLDLGAIEGPTTVYGVGSSLALSITGGQGATNDLQGGFAGDTIVAMGAGPGLGSNFLWGAGGGDVLTGVAGGTGNDVGSVFLLDSQFESPGGPQQAPAGIDLTITNFHSDTDTVLINPGALALGDIPVFIGTAADYLGALAMLAAPALAGHSATSDDHMLAVWSLLVHVVAASLWVGGGAVRHSDTPGKTVRQPKRARDVDSRVRREAAMGGACFRRSPGVRKARLRRATARCLHVCAGQSRADGEQPGSGPRHDIPCRP